MKHLYLSLVGSLFLAGSMNLSAQCVADYDFGDAEWGAFPDASVGEQFDTAYVGVPYLDVFHVLVPEDASAIEPTLTFPIDSVILVSASLIDTVTMQALDFGEVGLDIVCNNNGTSSNPCTLIAPGQYCANLEGTPNVSGVYQLTLDVLAYVTVFGQAVGQPFDFTGYILDIKEGSTNGIQQAKSVSAALYPNPANDQVYLSFDGASGIQWRVLDITGREVESGIALGQMAQWSVADWNDGVYFVSWTQQGNTTTRRLVVQH